MVRLFRVGLALLKTKREAGGRCGKRVPFSAFSKELVGAFSASTAPAASTGIVSIARPSRLLSLLPSLEMGHEQRSRTRLPADARCYLCGNAIEPDEEWDRDHVPPKRIFA